MYRRHSFLGAFLPRVLRFRMSLVAIGTITPGISFLLSARLDTHPLDPDRQLSLLH